MSVKKLRINDTSMVGNNLQERTNSNIVNAIFGNDRSEANSRVIFEEVPVEDITPRVINKYSQTRIARLAKSIKNTNGRLIHPIILVKPCDLPENHEVILKLKANGTNISEIKYILVAGERRYRAWLMNRAEEQERIDGLGLIQSNPYDTITANILTKDEAMNEKIFYEDSNDEARQLTPIEGMLHIKDALAEIKTDKQKRDILIEMNNGSAEGVPENEYAAAKKFNVSKYIEFYLENELGIIGWKPSTIKTYLSIVNNCCEEVVNAILKAEYPAREARNLTSLPFSSQLQLLDMYKNNLEEYKIRIASISENGSDGKKKVKRFTYKDVKRELNSLIKEMEDTKNKLELVAPELGRDDKASARKTIRQIDDMILKLKEREELFK